MTDLLTGYSEMAVVLDRLPLLCREARRARKLALRSAAVQIGTNAPTLLRFEQGAASSSRLLPLVLRWLDEPTEKSPS